MASPLKVVAVRLRAETAQYLAREAEGHGIVISEHMRRILERHVQTVKRYRAKDRNMLPNDPYLGADPPVN